MANGSLTLQLGCPSRAVWPGADLRPRAIENLAQGIALALRKSIELDRVPVVGEAIVVETLQERGFELPKRSRLPKGYKSPEWVNAERVVCLGDRKPFYSIVCQITEFENIDQLSFFARYFVDCCGFYTWNDDVAGEDVWEEVTGAE